MAYDTRLGRPAAVMRRLEAQAREAERRIIEEAERAKDPEAYERKRKRKAQLTLASIFGMVASMQPTFQPRRSDTEVRAEMDAMFK